jgi:hypothetical protein
VQAWLDRHSKARALRRTHNVQEEFKRVTQYHEHPEEFTQYLVYTTIKTAFIGAVVGILAGVLFVFGQFVGAVRWSDMGGSLGRIRELLFLAGQLLGTMGTLLVITICRKALTTWQRVKNYDEYKSAVSQHLG